MAKSSKPGQCSRVCPRSKTHGKVNEYACPDCKGVTVTVDRDDGTTPFYIRCRATPGCEGMAMSRFYRPRAGTPPTHEWYAPDAAEMAALDEGTKDYVENGGMLLRRLDGKPEEHIP